MEQETNYAPNAQINTPRYWTIWILASVFYLYQYLVKTSICVIMKDVVTDINITDEIFASISAFFYLSYALMQIFAGHTLDRYGPRIPLALACFVCALGSLSFAISHNSFNILLARILMGIGASYGFISCAKIAATYFSYNLLTALLSTTMAFGTFGGIIAGYPLELLVKVFSWRQTMLIIAAFCALLSVLIYIILLKIAAKMKEEW